MTTDKDWPDCDDTVSAPKAPTPEERAWAERIIENAFEANLDASAMALKPKKSKEMSIHEKLIRYGEVEITLDMLDTPECQAITTELITEAINSILEEKKHAQKKESTD